MWETRKLGELVRFYSGGTPNKNIADYWNGDIPWISAKTMKSDRICTSELFITREGLEHGSKLAPKGSLLLLVRGSGLFNGIPVCYVEEPVAYNQDIKCIQSCSEIENEYIYYWLKANSDFLQKSLDITGIGAGKFDTKFLSELEVSYPDRETRRRIIEFADNLTRMLIVNNQINRNLSEQANAYYEEWKLKLTGETIELSEVIDVRDGTHASPKPQEEGYPLVTSKHLYEYDVDLESPNKISQQDYDKTNERSKVEYHDVLMSMIGTVGLVSFISRKEINFAIKNVALFRTSKKEELAYYFLLFLKSKDTKQYIESCLAGSTQQYISLTELRKMPIRVPGEEILEFNSVIKPMIDAICSNVRENQRLSELRDSLLPKLMSGELDVSDLDI